MAVKEKIVVVEESVIEKDSQPIVEKLDGLIKKVMEAGLYVLAFLFPLFFYPLTSEMPEINKQFLLVFVVAILFILWLARVVLGLKIRLAHNPLAPAILFFGLVYLVSSFLSKDLYQSFVGFGSSIAESFLTVATSIIFYFIIVNGVRTFKAARCLTVALIASISLAGLFAFLQLKGIYSLGWLEATKNPVFNTVGTHNSLAFLFGLAVVSICLLAFDRRLAPWLKGLLLSAGFLLLTFVLLLKFINVFLALAVVMLFIFILTFLRREEGLPRLLLIPMLILISVVVFYFIKLSPIKNVPAEVLPNAKLTLEVAKDTLKENLLFGSGPGTWVIDYTRFKLESVNLTNFWNVRFAKGWSYLMMLPATIGLVGFLAWLALIVLVFAVALKKVLKIKEFQSSEGALTMALFAAWIYLVIMQISYHVNITFQFLFWFVTALLVVVVNLSDEDDQPEVEETEIKFNAASPLASILSFAFLMIMAGAVIGLYFISRSYAADITYNKGLTAILVKGDIRQGIGLLEEGTLMNSHLDLYPRTLSQAYWLEVRQQVSQAPSAASLQIQEIRAMIDKMLNYAKAATDISPNNVENWLQRGRLYQGLIGFVGGSEEWARKSFEEAIKIDPKDPFAHVELARVYFTAAAMPSVEQNNKQAYLAKAEDNINEAIRLKSDYGSAYVLLANIYEQGGKINEAIARLEGPSVANDPGSIFQLGYLYYRQDKLSQAKNKFEKAVGLVNNFSNAKYFLGLIYDREGNSVDALQQFQTILSLNPGNQEVIKIIKNIKSGQPALTGLTSASVVPSEEPKTAPSQPGL